MCKYVEALNNNKKEIGFRCNFSSVNNQFISIEEARRMVNFSVVFNFGDYEKSENFNSFDEFIEYAKTLENLKKADVKCK